MTTGDPCADPPHATAPRAVPFDPALADLIAQHASAGSGPVFPLAPGPSVPTMEEFQGKYVTVDVGQPGAAEEGRERVGALADNDPVPEQP